MTHYSALFSVRRLWLIFAVGMLVMFGTLLYFGRQIYQTAPPIPTSVADGIWRHNLYARRDRARPECLAVDGRHGAGLDLGPRQLCRAGLERRLAAS